MKFRDPETGKVYENIDDAAHGYCVSRGCGNCTWVDEDVLDCFGYPRENPREAAERMGYEVIEDEP